MTISLLFKPLIILLFATLTLGGENIVMESKQELKKGPWKPEEDLLLTRYIEVHGEGKWATVSKRSGLMRGGKSCRLRWKNYLRPNLKRGEMSKEEEDLIIRMHKLLGNRWSLIAGRLPGRTDNEVKNYWNTHLSKKYCQGQADTDKSNLKKRKQTHSSDTTQPCRKRPHIVTSCNGMEGNFGHNMINKLDDGSDDLQITVPDHTCMDDFKSFHYEQQSQLLPSSRKFYDDPFLPSLDSTFSLDPFGHGTKYWTDLPIYSPESIYQILL